VGVAVGVLVGSAVGTALGVGEGVIVRRLGMGTAVNVDVGVAVGVNVGVGIAVDVRKEANWQPAIDRTQTKANSVVHVTFRLIRTYPLCMLATLR